MSSVRDCYDALAADYHLMFRLGAGPQWVLDSSCGIGTQAIGLAGAGHDVVGSDLSPAAVAR